MATGVFSLRKVYIKQNENITNKNTLSWTEYANYGYFCGGRAPSFGPFSNSIYGHDYSNDTFSFIGPFGSPGATNHGTVKSLDNAYIMGGEYLPQSETTDVVRRFSFNTSTVSLPGKNLPASTAKTYFSTVETSNYGYIAGGQTYVFPAQFPNFCTITRLEFSNETFALPGKNLPQVIRSQASVQTNNYGYFAGGMVAQFPNNIIISTITRLDFSNETISNPGKDLPSARYVFSGVNNTTYGYFAGGSYSPPPTYISTITRLDFSNETLSDPGKNLPTTSYNPTDSGVNGSTFGYIYDSLYSFKLDYSTEDASNAIIFSQSLWQIGKNAFGKTNFPLSTTPSKTYGYFAGGFFTPPPQRLCLISRLDFSNETVSDPGKNLPTSRSSSAATSSNYYGYFAGGFSPPTIATITRLDFSNETVSDPGKNLPTVRNSSSTTSSNSYGYFGGGSPTVNTITRLDFSNETVSNPGKNLPTSRYGSAGTSSSFYGYFAGGFSPPSINTISRLDFSNETISDPGNNLPASTYYLTAISSSSYGYFGGGYPIANVVSRLDFSNEIVSNPGNNLPSVFAERTATSSSFYGYFAGGYNPLTNAIARLDFSNETVSEPGKNLLSPRAASAAVSNSN